jgi:hypothetical protein
MPASPFTLAFDHFDECELCDYAERRLCLRGRLLFRAAHDACKLIVEGPEETPRTKA